MPAIPSTLGRQACIIVTPTPTTLSESAAILKTLQSFGPVSTFLNPLYVPALKSKARNTFYAIFNDAAAMEKARVASPMGVDVGHDAIDPKEADPLNLRGWWGRKQVERKTFTCHVYGDNQRPTRHQKIVKANMYNGPFRLDRLAVTFQDLMRQGAPLPEFADCFQKRQLDDQDRKRFEEERQSLSFYKADENGETRGGLMNMWREDLKSEGISSSEEILRNTELAVHNEQKQRVSAEEEISRP